MASHQEVGALGEAIAKAYLEDQGYEVLEINWRHGRVELDLICRLDNLLIFVEVKSRHSAKSAGHPAYSLTEAKQNRLRLCAAAYQASIGHTWAIRFDLITIILHDTDHELEHYQDVFF